MEKRLNTDQRKALQFILSWYKGNDLYCILDGAGGVGKSFLVNEIIKYLPTKNIVLLAPTHEALSQLREKVEGKYPFKTICSSLGITPTTSEETLQFEHKGFPSFWDEIDLAIIDEVSMIPEWILKLLQQTGVKILFVGHKSQLPPIEGNKRRNYKDKCVSPVFTKGYPTVTLKEPMRNSGTLWEFTNALEERIYSGEKKIPSLYNKSQKEITEFCLSSEGKDLFRTGDIKVVAYHNSEVRTRNARVRKNLFGDIAKTNKYLPGDRLVLVSPVNVIPDLEKCRDTYLKSLIGSKSIDSLFNNTKGIVQSCNKVQVTLNSKLVIPCYKLEIIGEFGSEYIYDPIYEQSYTEIDEYYKHIAWGMPNAQKKGRAFAEKHFISHCFSRILHFYSGTTYRMQGSTIKNVIVINPDLERIENPVEQMKHQYVAASRTAENLMWFNG